MRRTTLGGLSASALNARPALGGRLGEPGKAALPPPAPRAERSAGDLGAPSGAFGARTSLRRTSVFSGSGSALRQARAHACAAGLRAPAVADARCLQDPRPVADKAFVAGCTQALITFLATRGYDRPLSPKLLSSNKEFAAVVAFLARRVDPGAPPLGPRVEEEVPALFKRLRYPFAIPKSALQAVGSPHTWPALVAALAWLVELLRYEEAASAGGSAAGALAQGGAAAATERGFFDFCAASYGAYLAGDDARVAALDATLEAAHGDADAAAADEAARQAEANASLDQQLRSARDAAVPLADLGAKKVRESSSLLTRAHSHPFNSSNAGCAGGRRASPGGAERRGGEPRGGAAVQADRPARRGVRR